MSKNGAIDFCQTVLATTWDANKWLIRPSLAICVSVPWGAPGLRRWHPTPHSLLPTPPLSSENVEEVSTAFDPNLVPKAPDFFFPYHFHHTPPGPPLALARPCLSTRWALNRFF